MNQGRVADHLDHLLEAAGSGGMDCGSGPQ
jgi:hypothetical protein